VCIDIVAQNRRPDFGTAGARLMAMEITLSLEQEALLDASATRLNRSKQALVADAVAAFLEHETWFRDAVEKGRDSVRQGRVIEHAEVARRLDQQFRE
jgi:predicted transcriptional regulator